MERKSSDRFSLSTSPVSLIAYLLPAIPLVIIVFLQFDFSEYNPSTVKFGVYGFLSLVMLVVIWNIIAFKHSYIEFFDSDFEFCFKSKTNNYIYTDIEEIKGNTSERVMIDFLLIVFKDGRKLELSRANKNYDNAKEKLFEILKEKNILDSIKISGIESA